MTKSDLEEVLDSKEYVTKSFLEESFEQKLESYVTKEYLDQKLREQNTDFRQYIESLMEHQIQQLQIFVEQMDTRYVLRRDCNMLR